MLYLLVRVVVIVVVAVKISESKGQNRKLRNFGNLILNKKNNTYNLRKTQLLDLSKCRTKTYGLNTTLFKGALLWNKLPNHFKEAKSLIHFKNKTRESTVR